MHSRRRTLSRKRTRTLLKMEFGFFSLYALSCKRTPHILHKFTTLTEQQISGIGFLKLSVRKRENAFLGLTFVGLFSYSFGVFKPWPNGCNMSAQHCCTQRCCVCLATVLRARFTKIKLQTRIGQHHATMLHDAVRCAKILHPFGRDFMVTLGVNFASFACSISLCTCEFWWRGWGFSAIYVALNGDPKLMFRSVENIFPKSTRIIRAVGRFSLEGISPYSTPPRLCCFLPVTHSVHLAPYRSHSHFSFRLVLRHKELHVASYSWV